MIRNGRVGYCWAAAAGNAAQRTSAAKSAKLERVTTPPFLLQDRRTSIADARDTELISRG